MAKLKKSTGFKTLDRELEKDKYEGKIESFSNENYGSLNDGYWLYLHGHCGYHNDGRHSVHEWTIGELISALRDIRPCECEKCSSGQVVWADATIHESDKIYNQNKDN